MRAKFFLISVLVLGFNSVSFSQDVVVSDDELLKYATAIDSVSKMTKSLNDTITNRVKKAVVVNIARYNELFKIIEDPMKLEEAKATPEEVAFVKDIVSLKVEGKAKISIAFQNLAKEYVGAATFNKVKKAIAEDPNLKSKYESLLEELKKDNGSQP